MSKQLYCSGKIDGGKYEINIGDKKSAKHRKRIDIVSIKMIRESSMLYGIRRINQPNDAVGIARRFLDDADREQLLVCSIDVKNQPTSIAVVSIGSINSSIVHPREVFKTAILSNAASIIVFHNHPSGDTTPSKEDINVTNRLKEAGKILGIEVLDHIIIGKNGNFHSIRESGVI
ncbi:JAB domain-containing protein [Clostridium intestinale]|uniref:JAB domain-containing protein n=1 Tax=Clostridium intestinale TaxID=36845 RepID=UPI003075E809